MHNRLGETNIEMQGNESFRGACIWDWHSEERPTLCASGSTRTSKLGRMRSAQRLGDSSCMVPKTKGAARYMHLVSEMHLTEELRRFNLWRGVEQVVERGKEATSPKGLSYSKAKRQS
ncbi:hypothetical protein B296_00053721 [Ensete ventricosum]|uniref:Uncharacterized protein n=1 Tax=Ensete ventricosum TaxID=4639 RepID=A0A426Y6V3_ENSVE|nr:hypothetical protein B296_00053721 [Ensete ventricosum]